MTAQRKPPMSEEEYLVFERTSPIKHEYYHGRVYAMTGASERHNLITVNMLAALHSHLRRSSCRVYPSDMRVKVQQTGLYTYPDAVIVCGKSELTGDAPETLVNPTVIIEVLSPSTERYDRGVKFQHYRTIPTLREYVLIAQDDYSIEYYIKQANSQWLLQEARGIQASITLPSINYTLSLEDVYEQVVLEAEDTDILRETPPE